MRTRNRIQYVAMPARIFVTLLILLIVVAICQLIALESARTFVLEAPAQEERTEERERKERIRSAQREFLPDGTLHLVAGGRPYSLPTHQEVYDANGTLLWEGPPEENPYEYLSWATDNTTLSEESMKRLQAVNPGALETLDIPVATVRQTLEIWRYNHSGGYFAGYATTGRRVGFIGGAGFAESESEVRPFGVFRSFAAWCPTGSYSPTLIWQTRSRICQIDFEQRQVKQLLENPQSELERLFLHHWGAFGVEDAGDRRRYRPLLVCRSADGKYHLLLKEPAQTLTVSPPREWDRWWGGREYDFTAAKDGVFLRRFWLDYPAAPPDYGTNARRAWWHLRKDERTSWVELYRVNDQGGLELINRKSWQLPAQSGRWVHWAQRYEAMHRAANVFSPVLYDFVWWPLSSTFGPDSKLRDDFLREFMKFIGQLRPGVSPWNVLVATVLVFLTFLHARPRRSSWPALTFWLTFVALFNVGGFLTYWALNHTPTIKCASCGKARGLHQSDCVRCGAVVAAPKPSRRDLILGV